MLGAFELSDVPAALGILSALALVIVFLLAVVRKLTREAEDADVKHKVDLNDLAQSRIDLLAGEVQRVTAELASERSTSAHLAGQVEQMSKENAELRRIVLHDALPAAMQGAMQTLATAISDSSQALIAEYRTAAKREHDAQFEVLRAIAQKMGATIPE